MSTVPRAFVVDDILNRIRSEYAEMPGLSVTLPQAARLWSLDTETCAQVLHVLVAGQFLRCTPAGLYVRGDRRAVPAVAPRMVKSDLLHRRPRANAS